MRNGKLDVKKERNGNGNTGPDDEDKSDGGKRKQQTTKTTVAELASNLKALTNPYDRDFGFHLVC